MSRRNNVFDDVDFFSNWLFKRDNTLPEKRIPSSLKLVPFVSFGGLMYFGHCMENLKCQKDWDKLGEDLRAMVYNTYSTVKTFAQDTIFFIGQSIEDIQNYFTESNGKYLIVAFFSPFPYYSYYILYYFSNKCVIISLKIREKFGPSHNKPHN